ncbi:hypothetical protein DPH57_09230 [Massilia sp. YMA4]|nr:hypothetical protein DPH57_09230 [Massilia sp. YMA4]
MKRIEALSDARTPLEEKLDLLRWVFTDPALDTQPFSFVNCVKVVSLSPLSPAPYFIGMVDSEEVRDWIRRRIGVWLTISVDSYPAWVQQAIAARPDWIASQLERNPQWLNEQLRRSYVEGDLFT